MLIWLSNNRCKVGVPHGIVRAGELQRVLEAQALQEEFGKRGMEALTEARAQARRIVNDAQAHAEGLIEQANGRIEAAVLQGAEDGKRQAVFDWHEEQARMNADKAKSLKSMHATLAEIVTTAVERIVQTESRTALYQRALKNVQQLTRGATSLTLRVSGDDYEHAHATLAALATSGMTTMPIDVLVEPGLRPGSCIFESDMGVLDASLETQLDGLRLAVARALRKAAPAEADADAEAAEAHCDFDHPDDEPPQADWP
jgi:type III secretion protein L